MEDSRKEAKGERKNFSKRFRTATSQTGPLKLQEPIVPYQFQKEDTE